PGSRGRRLSRASTVRVLAGLLAVGGRGPGACRVVGSRGLGQLVRLPTALAVAVGDQLDDLLDGVGDDQQLQVGRRDQPVCQRLVLDPVDQPAPVGAAEENDRKLSIFLVWTSVSASKSSSRVP